MQRNPEPIENKWLIVFCLVVRRLHRTTPLAGAMGIWVGRGFSMQFTSEKFEPRNEFELAMHRDRQPSQHEQNDNQFTGEPHSLTYTLKRQTFNKIFLAFTWGLPVPFLR